ncbi:S-methyl-5-thioribose-1-phosphate isomerase [bacterium]|nr:S-methyl-5-thioribose-1-phosphate isomerase [bacterium]
MLNPIRWTGGGLTLLDQRRLPAQTVYLKPKNVNQVADAIRTLAVRGAPAIGIAAAYGVVLGLKRLAKSSGARAAAVDQAGPFSEIVETLRSTRPTAVNLFWALERMRRRFLALPPAASLTAAVRALEAEAVEIHREDQASCAAIGRHGAELLPQKATVVTHCNAGILATGGIGTALGVIYQAADLGKTVRVFADETRPLLQGARLTAFELAHHGIDVTLMSDGMSAALFSRTPVDAVIVGADRIARNGDTANKIGTFSLAISARFHNVPFYVAAPVSTFDLSIARGHDIPIEERAEEEITRIGAGRAPRGVRAFNPAFDVTPARLITAIITDLGVIRPVTEQEITRVIGGRR